MTGNHDIVWNSSVLIIPKGPLIHHDYLCIRDNSIKYTTLFLDGGKGGRIFRNFTQVLLNHYSGSEMLKNKGVFFIRAGIVELSLMSIHFHDRYSLQ